jgi:hypothetical protein
MYLCGRAGAQAGLDANLATTFIVGQAVGRQRREPPAQERSVGGATTGSRTHDDPNCRSGGSIG